MATNTATTSVTHTGNGSTNAFAIPFSFLADITKIKSRDKNIFF